MKRYNFEINYKTNDTEVHTRRFGLYYESYHQAFDYILGYISAMQKEEKIKEIKIKEI